MSVSRLNEIDLNMNINSDFSKDKKGFNNSQVIISPDTYQKDNKIKSYDQKDKINENIDSKRGTYESRISAYQI